MTQSAMLHNDLVSTVRDFKRMSRQIRDLSFLTARKQAFEAVRKPVKTLDAALKSDNGRHQSLLAQQPVILLETCIFETSLLD